MRLIPLLILLPIGFSVPVGDTGTHFYDLVTNNWQPILAQASLFIAIVGYYVPGMINLPASLPAKAVTIDSVIPMLIYVLIEGENHE